MNFFGMNCIFIPKLYMPPNQKANHVSEVGKRTCIQVQLDMHLFGMNCIYILKLYIPQNQNANHVSDVGKRTCLQK